jgi:uncharacterized SAM-binding protein YcdF (DUF218 family)
MRLFAHYVLINPAVWFVAYLLIVAVFNWKRRKWLSILAVILLPLFYGALPKWIISTWEQEFTPVKSLQESEVGLPILVLGAGSTPDERVSPVQQLHIPARMRLLEGIRLWMQSPGSQLIVSGAGRPGFVSQAEVYAQAASELGVPLHKIDTVSSPRTTFEEAVRYREKFPDHHKLVLVTSSLHMRRAVKIFEYQGIEVVPSPYHFLSLAHPDGPKQPFIIPSIEGLNLWAMVFHEWMGMLTLGR